MKARRTTAVLSAAVLGTLALSGCDKFSEPFKDAPLSNTRNQAPADLVNMPDGFSNVATKCDHGNRIYTAYHSDSAYASIAVVPNAPGC